MAVDLPTGLNSDSGKFDTAGLPADINLCWVIQSSELQPSLI
ncbi:MAG: hypothetical protein Ct9H300mP19_09030 [Dehalococcoidia bacterium]|nr:MAG: hypothetical protein Ct9H300mP19_09030 [Dehalococcoidia bacterium]